MVGTQVLTDLGQDVVVGCSPSDVSGFFALLTVPPGPPFPEELHLKKVCGVVWCYVGTEEDAKAALAPIRAKFPPILDGVAGMPLPALQAAFDGLYPPGDQWYCADFVDTIPAKAVEAHVSFAQQFPPWKSTMHLYPIDGAARRVAPDSTPWTYRHARFSQVIVGVDPDPAMAGPIRDWTVGYWDALHGLTRVLAAPWAARGIRVNAIAPGWFPTEMTGQLTNPEQVPWIDHRTPMGRAGLPGELDGALVFLASDASSYLVGQTLVVDGGWTLW